ncbi:hypothetical protein JXA70_03150 [candidate division KSB1 bacterium]|nr:hypothetical protein [candidate division KSB1 bacterium]
MQNCAILAVDIGTTGLKMGIYTPIEDDLVLVKQYAEPYQINSYNNGLCGDIEPEKWLAAFRNGCHALQPDIGRIEVISLSGTTPGLTAMDEHGQALSPAILMLDQRSRKQAQRIIDTIGLEFLLQHTGNMPVAGGCSLASILWIREHLADVYRRTFKFGHSNTVIGYWLTGQWGIDPSSASLSALYNTVKNDLTWNVDILQAFDLSLDMLPPVKHAADSLGHVTSELCAQLGFQSPPYVVIGGNDAVLAAYSAGIYSPGQIINVNGTCEITLVCLGECIPSPNYNIRAHVIGDRWLTLHVMNAGGKAYEWFKNLFCRDMTEEKFYGKFIPQALELWLQKQSDVFYDPYLLGSRYSQQSLKAKLEGLTVDTSREELLAALTKGLCEYQKRHLQDMQLIVALQSPIKLTGGALNDAIIRAKKQWYWATDYEIVEQSSLRGAAILGLTYIEQHGGVA